MVSWKTQTLWFFSSWSSYPDVEITLVDNTQGRMNKEDMFRVNDLDGDEVVVDVSASKKVEHSEKVVEKEISSADLIATAASKKVDHSEKVVEKEISSADLIATAGEVVTIADPLAKPNQDKKTKRRRTKESESSKKPSTTKETPKGKALSKGSKTGDPASAKEPVKERIVEVWVCNSLVHSSRALSALRRSDLRTASTAAKSYQGDSLEFYMITGSIYTDQRGIVVLATLFNGSEQRHFRSFITTINLQESRRLQLLAKRM
nr:hypothetical protein [Tanacetum cinerariifolium]